MLINLSENESELNQFFKNEKIYPLRIQDFSLSKETKRLYAEWTSRFGSQLLSCSQPWLPIGHLGPCLILGHYDLNLELVGIDENFVQKVIMTPKDYIIALDIVLKNNFELIEHKFNEKLLNKVDSKETYLNFIIDESFADDMLKVLFKKLKGQRDWSIKDLLQGYCEAFYFLTSQRPIIDISNVQINQSLHKKIPETLRLRYNALCFNEVGDTLFVAISDTNFIEFESDFLIP